MDRGFHQTRNAKIREQVGDARSDLRPSGGVIPPWLRPRTRRQTSSLFFIDHGSLRAGEREQVENDYARACGGLRHHVTSPAGPRPPWLTEPEAKRKIIGQELIRSFEASLSAQKQVIEEAEALGEGAVPRSGHSCTPTSSSPAAARRANIKSHHNARPPEDMT